MIDLSTNSINTHQCHAEPWKIPASDRDIPHSLASIDKARKNLGYEPKYSLQEGLKIAV